VTGTRRDPSPVVGDARRSVGPVSNDTVHEARQVPHPGTTGRKTGLMRIARYVVLGVLVIGLLVTSVGWYLSAHPGGERFESCHWDGNDLVLGYTYGSGDTVSTMVHPSSDHVVAQLRVDEAGGAQPAIALTGEARYPISGGPRAVEYPNGAELNCPVR
jgi:hypothetical protein